MNDKPCPSCNKTENLREISDGDKIQCCICTTTMPRGLWSHRPIEDALQAENERLKAKIERLSEPDPRDLPDWESGYCT